MAEKIVKEISDRVQFLVNVGLDYLSLDRAAGTLSGGEAQRIRLATQIGSGLVGVLYVLDEPSIGLHQRDNARLIATLRRLRDLGNTVLVVEHDEETIHAADYVIDFGPGAGHLGGKVIAAGTPDEIARDPDSITGAFLSGRERIEVPEERRRPRGWIEILGASEHNLKGIDVRFPIGVLASVTGVSGAGKSSLINGILLPALARKLHDSADRVDPRLVVAAAVDVDHFAQHRDHGVLLGGEPGAEPECEVIGSRSCIVCDAVEPESACQAAARITIIRQCARGYELQEGPGSVIWQRMQ